MIEKKNSLKKKDMLKILKKDYFVGDKLECGGCGTTFGIEFEYMGVITCPYCSEYVEG